MPKKTKISKAFLEKVKKEKPEFQNRNIRKIKAHEVSFN
jgi:hypothetical protein